MARANKIVVIDAENRDKGKAFFLSEMPPRKAEKWAARALLAFGRASNAEVGADFREALADAGMAGVAALGIRAFTALSFEDAEPLLDEMLQCISVVPDPARVDQTTRLPYSRPLMDEDIEEVSTLLTLRSEVLELHTGFSVAAFLSRLGQAAKSKFNSSGTPTSPQSSGE